MEAQPEGPGRSSPSLLDADLLQLLPGEAGPLAPWSRSHCSPAACGTEAAPGRTATLAGPPARAAPLAPKPGGLSQLWEPVPATHSPGCSWATTGDAQLGDLRGNLLSCAQAAHPGWPSGPATQSQAAARPPPWPRVPALPSRQAPTSGVMRLDSWHGRSRPVESGQCSPPAGTRFQPVMNGLSILQVGGGY